MRSALEDLQEVFDGFVGELDGVRPPDPADGTHKQRIDAFRDLQNAFDDATTSVARAQTPEDLAAIFRELQAPTTRAQVACVELQRIAGDNEIDVNLDCADAE